MIRLPKIRSKAIRRLPSEMDECELKIGSFVGIPCSSNETLVLAHNPWNPLKGQATKGCDVSGIISCASCHDILDGRNKVADQIKQHNAVEFFVQIMRAEHLSRARMIDAGLIVVPDGEIVGKGF